MFERLTDRPRRIVVLAQEEARVRNHDFIAPAHLLIALINEREGIGAQVLESFGISLEEVQAETEAVYGNSNRAPGVHIPFNPHTKNALELALREALQLGHNYIGTEHLALALIRLATPPSYPVEILTKIFLGHDVELSSARQKVLALLGSPPTGSDTPPPPPVRWEVLSFKVTPDLFDLLKPLVSKAASEGRPLELAEVVEVVQQSSSVGPPQT